MKEQVELEKVWIDLYPKQEVLLQSLQETLEMTAETLLIIDGSTNYELAKQKQGHLLGTTPRTLNSNLSRLRNNEIRYVFVTASSLTSPRFPLDDIAEFRKGNYIVTNAETISSRMRNSHSSSGLVTR
jgi:hypothetical protein